MRLFAIQIIEIIFRHAMNQLQSTDQQLAAVNEFFSQLAGYGRQLTYVEAEELAA